jgi:hypothetical protein
VFTIDACLSPQLTVELLTAYALPRFCFQSRLEPAVRLLNIEEIRKRHSVSIVEQVLALAARVGGVHPVCMLCTSPASVFIVVPP